MWGAVATGLTGVVGSIAGLFGQRAAQQQAFEQNKELAALQNKYSLEQWQREIAYNDPRAQMARLKAAGINPDLAYANGGMQNVAPSSPAMASGTPIQPLDVQAGVQNAIGNFNTLLNGVTDAVGKHIQNTDGREQILATTEKIKQDVTVSQKTIEQINEAILNLQAARPGIEAESDSKVVQSYRDQQDWNDLQIARNRVSDVDGGVLGSELNVLSLLQRLETQFHEDAMALDVIKILRKHSGEIAEGRLSQEVLPITSLKRLKFDLEQDESLPKILDSFGLEGEHASTWSKVLKALFMLIKGS